MRGRRGSRITITVLREDETIDHEMRREVIRVASVHYETLEPSYGYVRLSQFSESTARDLSRAINEMQDEQDGMLDGLILDLRNNPGGVLDAAIDVSDLFLRLRGHRFRRGAYGRVALCAFGASWRRP